MTSNIGQAPGPTGSISTAGLLRAARRIGIVVVFGIAPALLFLWWLGYGVAGDRNDWAFDFRQFWQGGRDVAHGASPYPSESLLRTSGDWLDPVTIQEVFRFPYPAPAALALVPLGALPFDVAAIVWATILTAAVAGTLALLGVRDWRVYGVVFGSAPVIGAVRLGTMTPILMLLLAVAWRWRDRPRVAGGAVAGLLVLKLFAWPLVVWLALTRRWLAAGLAAGFALVSTLAAWAVIGFDGLARYPELLRRLSDVVADRGLSLVALGDGAGLGRGAGALPWVAATLTLVAAGLIARRAGGDRRVFSLCIAAALLSSPIVWNHYYALLVVPLALAWPRLSWQWLLLWVFWVIPAQENEGDIWRVVVAFALLTCCTALVMRRSAGPAVAAPAVSRTA